VNASSQIGLSLRRGRLTKAVFCLYTPLPPGD